ncbi:MAG: DegQ family serine endoprotease [Deltaproteobacteria bacterium]|nr:MAG: DegQ family serine endoprotease [Deltaproteobacteria bacterium]
MHPKSNLKIFAQFSLVRVLVTMLLILSCATNSFASDIDDENIALLDKTAKAFTAVVKKAMPAVVFVQVEKTVERGGAVSPFQFQDPSDFFNDPFFEHFFGPHFQPKQGTPKKFQQRGQGSGFIIDKAGYILINNHIVGDADLIKVKLADGREFKAKVIGTDPQSDVAVIKIDATDLPVLCLGDSDKLDAGEWVIAIGNPFGLSETVTVGVVSAKGRSRVGINDYEDFIQTDAAINPGNSGGPLVNIHGEAVGMNTAIFSRSGGYMGIGFAIPINMAKAIVDQLLKKGKVTRGWLGVVIQDIDEELAESFGLKKTEGVLVAEVSEGSPAEKAGLKQGDIILSLNGKKVEELGELRNKIAMTSPGTKLNMEVLRENKHKTLQVTIGEQPVGKIIGTAQHEILGKLGLVVQDLTGELAEQFGYREAQGVLVAEVEQGSSAARVGIRPGHLIEEVNRKRIHNMDEFIKALAQSKQTNSVLFRIRDGEFSRYVAIRID